MNEEQRRRLNIVSTPAMTFPYSLYVATGQQAVFPGTTVDGETYGPSPFPGGSHPSPY